MTMLAPEPKTTVDGGGSDVSHWVCDCDPDAALCGAGVADEEWMDDDEDVTCVVCNDLVDIDCPKCG